MTIFTFYHIDVWLPTKTNKISAQGTNESGAHTHIHTYACINLGPLGTGVIRCKRNLLGKRPVKAKEERGGEGGRAFRLECKSDTLEGGVKEGVRGVPVNSAVPRSVLSNCYESSDQTSSHPLGVPMGLG